MANIRPSHDHTAYRPLRFAPSPDETYVPQEAGPTSASDLPAKATRPLIAHPHEDHDDTLPRSEE